jgi:ABC-type nitrate/sulfonate/bicarbonate transport system substrate-binding protein
MKNFFLLVILIAALFGLLELKDQSSTQKPQTKSQEQPFTIALDWTPNTNHTGIYVALNKKWYRDEGLDVKILPYSQVSADTLVYAGKADAGISSTENIIAQEAVGAPVVSIAAIVAKNTSGIITLEKSGIESPKDLDGKIYGGFGLPYEEAVIKQVIKSDGGAGEFTNVILETSAMDALESGRIDFVWVFEGWDKIIAGEKKIGVRFFPITDFGVPDYYTPNIITGPKQLESKKDLLRKFMSATKKGYEFAIKNPKESADILIKEVPAGTFPEKNLVYKSQEFLSKVYEENNNGWGIQTKSMWENYPEFMLQNNAVTNAEGNPVTEMNLQKLYTNDFLK